MLQSALVLFSHGSLLCGAGEALEAHAARLRAGGEWEAVEIGYLNYSDPPFANTVNRLAENGARHITVVPYFLVPGYFVGKSLPRAVAAARQAHPDVEFVVTDALGFDDALVDALLACAATARPSDAWRDPLRRAASACRPSPTCPLYGTPACPKVPRLPEETPDA